MPSYDAMIRCFAILLLDGDAIPNIYFKNVFGRCKIGGPFLYPPFLKNYNYYITLNYEMPISVIPSLTGNPVKYDGSWIPAFAGMTEMGHFVIQS